MFSILNKLFASFSIKNIIYLGIVAMGITIICISSLFIYTSNSILESQESMNDIFKIEEQSKEILKKVQKITDIEMQIILAKSNEDFNNINNTVFENIELKKLNINTTKDKLEKYNNSLEVISNQFNEHLKIKREMQELAFSIYDNRKEILSDLSIIEEEMKIISTYTKSISGKIKLHNKRVNRNLVKELKNREFEKNIMLPKLIKALTGSDERIKNDITSFEESILSSIIISREISLSNNKDELIDIKTNKIIQSRKILDKKLINLQNKLKDNFELSDILLNISVHIFAINELENSLIVIKEFSFSQREKLEELIKKRDEINDEINKNIKILSNLSKEINNDIITTFKETSKNTLYVVIIIICIVTFFLISFGLILLSRVNKPLIKITKSIENISQENNNLDEYIEVKYDDEFKKLVNAFNNMTFSLSKNIKKLKKRDKEISLLNKDLEKRVEQRTNELSQKTQKISDLFNNAKQGFLSFNNELIVDEEYSIECEKLLGSDIVGNDVSNLFYKEDSSKKDFFKQTLKDILEENDEIIQNSYIDLLPKEFVLNKRAINIEYKKLSDDRLMLVLTNVTSQKKLEQRIKKEQQILKMIVTIVSDSTQFYDIMSDFKEFEDNKLNIFELNNSLLFNLSETYRDVHTLKGLFSQIYMSNIVKKLHSFETEISALIENKDFTNNDFKVLLSNINFLDWLNDDLEVISSVLGDSFINEESIIKINENSVIKLEEKISEYCDLDKQHSNYYKDILYETQKLRSRTLYQSLQMYPRLCIDLAEKLGKQLYSFKILGDEKIVLPPNFKPFIKSLIHVFRNLIDHGIEDVERRIELDKNENGTIVCNFKIEKDNLVIVISDDGQGIDKEKIKRKVLEEKLLSIEEFNNMSEDRIYGLIFYESFSTSEKITDISGRGIGMSAVKNELVKIKGSVEIKSVINKGTTFIFKLPYKRKESRDV